MSHPATSATSLLQQTVDRLDAFGDTYRYEEVQLPADHSRPCSFEIGGTADRKYADGVYRGPGHKPEPFSVNDPMPWFTKIPEWVVEGFRDIPEKDRGLRAFDLMLWVWMMRKPQGQWDARVSLRAQFVERGIVSEGRFKESLRRLRDAGLIVTVSLQNKRSDYPWVRYDVACHPTAVSKNINDNIRKNLGDPSRVSQAWVRHVKNHAATALKHKCPGVRASLSCSGVQNWDEAWYGYYMRVPRWFNYVTSLKPSTWLFNLCLLLRRPSEALCLRELGRRLGMDHGTQLEITRILRIAGFIRLNKSAPRNEVPNAFRYNHVFQAHQVIEAQPEEDLQDAYKSLTPKQILQAHVLRAQLAELMDYEQVHDWLMAAYREALHQAVENGKDIKEEAAVQENLKPALTIEHMIKAVRALTPVGDPSFSWTPEKHEVEDAERVFGPSILHGRAWSNLGGRANPLWMSAPAVLEERLGKTTLLTRLPSRCATPSEFLQVFQGPSGTLGARDESDEYRGEADRLAPAAQGSGPSAQPPPEPEPTDLLDDPAEQVEQEILDTIPADEQPRHRRDRYATPWENGGLPPAFYHGYGAQGTLCATMADFLDRIETPLERYHALVRGHVIKPTDSVTGPPAWILKRPTQCRQWLLNSLDARMMFDRKDLRALDDRDAVWLAARFYRGAFNRKVRNILYVTGFGKVAIRKFINDNWKDDMIDLQKEIGTLSTEIILGKYGNLFPGLDMWVPNASQYFVRIDEEQDRNFERVRPQPTRTDLAMKRMNMEHAVLQATRVAYGTVEQVADGEFVGVPTEMLSEQRKDLEMESIAWQMV